MTDHNPTEKPEAVRAAPKANEEEREKDAPWIRDVRARDLVMDLRNMETCAAVCEGMRVHCQHCGEGFPLWPPKLLMGHIQAEHAKDLTMQQLSGCAALCSDEWDGAHAQYLTMYLVTLVPLRRRCRDLGVVRFLEPPQESPKRIVVPN